MQKSQAPISSSISSKVNDIDLFHMILEAYNWVEIRKNDSTDDMTLFNNHPEAVYGFTRGKVSMTAKFHEPINMISLRIQSRSAPQFVQLHFMYHDKIEEILEWIATNSDSLSTENYHVLLRKASGKCEMILLELENNKMYELIPPKTHELTKK